MVKMIKVALPALVTAGLSIGLLSFNGANAQSTQDNATKIDYYKADNNTNSIPYFDNRFRIDAELDEITLIFYRRSGSKPIILIRPDGSKIRVNNYDEEMVEWFDDRTYDMIRIKKPMPGPWQAVGNILPNSEILVVSDVKIVVPPLPEIMLSGETIKVEGKLVNGNDPITNHLFRDVVELQVQFISTNNSAYDNFGAENVELTRFRDDGRDLDEYKNDGVFTGEFALTIASGEWIPIYKVDMPMAKRELRQKPIMLQKTPITIAVDVAKTEQAFHLVQFTIDSTYVEPSSVIFQGRITFPDKQSEPFSIMEGEGEVKDGKGVVATTKRLKKFGYTEPGVHRINVHVFGRTTNGREFRLVVPEFSFNVERTQQELLEHITDVNGAVPLIDHEAHAKQVAQQLLEEQERQAAELAEQKKQRWIIIAVANVLVLLIGLAVFFVIKRRKNSAETLEQ
jgi:uncharacterized protein (TIGR03503 family)